jgi:hypothetical protein
MNGCWDESLYEAAQGIPDAETYPTMDDYLDALEDLWDRLPHDESDNCSANFGATTYNWSIMKDTHSDWDPHPGDAEVAKLCHHVGIAVDMDYGVVASGAHGEDVDNALEEYFRYDSDAYDSSRDVDRMTEEIQWLRPVALAGFRETTAKTKQRGKVGHEWVVFGYNKATDPRQFWMNMGWGGAPGWYSCDEVYPMDQTHVTRIAPQDAVKFVGDDDPGDGSPSDPYEDIEEAIDEAPDDATLIFKAGSVNTFSAATLVIERRFTLKGWDVTIRKE